MTSRAGLLVRVLRAGCLFAWRWLRDHIGDVAMICAWRVEDVHAWMQTRTAQASRERRHA